MSKKEMPAPNVALKDFFADNKVFADVFNTYMYGKEVLQPEDLQPLDTTYSETVEEAQGMQVLGRYRDINRKAN